jgi:hypothetical protein
MSGWRRVVILVLASVIAVLGLSYGAYLVFQDTITTTIRDAMIEYVRTRVTEASSGRMDVEIGDISYTYVTGSLEVSAIRVIERDSALRGGHEVRITVPSVRVTGLLPWDVLYGRGLSVGTITVDAPRVEYRSWDRDTTTAPPSTDTAIVRLPQIPNADSLLHELFVRFVPTYVQPLRIDEVVVQGATLRSTLEGPEGRTTGEISGIRIAIGPITVDPRDAVQRTIGSVDVRFDRWHRISDGGREVQVRGLHLRVDEQDSSLAVDTVRMVRPDASDIAASAVRLSYRTKELSIGTCTVAPSRTDVAYFAAHRFNTDRIRVAARSLVLRSIDVDALEDRTALHVGAIDVGGLDLDILSNKRLGNDPRAKRPLMLNEIVRSLPFALSVDTVRVHDASIRYGESWSHSTTPALLTWSGVRLLATDMRSIAGPDARCTVWARGRFQDRATMEATFMIPLTAPMYALDANGSLSGPFDVTSLNSFLPIAENVRIRSGTARSARFAYTVRGRQCTGIVEPFYSDLSVDVVNARTKKKGGFLNAFVSLMANWLVIKNDNEGGEYAPGRIRLTLPKDAAIMQTIWFPIRAGLGDAAGF